MQTRTLSPEFRFMPGFMPVGMTACRCCCRKPAAREVRGIFSIGLRLSF